MLEQWVERGRRLSAAPGNGDASNGKGIDGTNFFLSDHLRRTRTEELTLRVVTFKQAGKLQDKCNGRCDGD